MSKYYLLFISDAITRERISHRQPRVNLSHPALHLQVGDKIVPVRDAKKQTILPFLYNVDAINRNTGSLTIQREDTYNRAINITEVVGFVSFKTYTPHDNSQQVTQNDFDLLVGNMGGKRMEERALLEYIERYITARGYYFERETLYNYHICLKTRPLVILAGLSGTGKSKLSQLYAEALGQKQHYLRLPVSPNWNDDRYLLGYFDTLTGQYITEAAAEFVLDANADPDNLYFFCLDEMNLAHVEHYFSQFLSAMEEEQLTDRLIRLMSNRVYAQMKKVAETDETESIQPTMLLPSNLFFTGTINIDETTKSISDKVIDRANTLEFFTVDLAKVPQPAELPQPVTISTLTWQSYIVTERNTAFRDQIIEIGKILNKADLGLGYRILHDIELYLANSQGLLDPLVAFDLQIKQRILPRVRGTEVIKNTIDDLLNFMKRNKLSRSEHRLNEMKNRLQRDGYTSFWR